MNQLIEYQDQFVKYHGTYKEENRLTQSSSEYLQDNGSGTSYNASQKESFVFNIKLKKETLDTQIIQKQSTLITQLKADNLKLRSVLQKTYKELKSTQSQLAQLKSQVYQFDNGYISEVILENSQLKINNQQMQSQLSQYKLKNTSDYISSLILENTQLKINYDNLLKEFDERKNSIIYDQKTQICQGKDSDEYISSLILQNTQLKANLQNLSKQTLQKIQPKQNQTLAYEIQLLKSQIQKLKQNQKQLLQDNYELQTQLQQKAKEIWILETKIIQLSQKHTHAIKQVYRKSNQSDSILIESQQFFQPKDYDSTYTQTQVYESFQFREKILDNSMTPSKRKNHHMSPAADKQYSLQEYARQLNQKQRETAHLTKKLQELQKKDSKLQVRLKRKQKQLKNANIALKQLKILNTNNHDQVIDNHHEAHQAQIQTDNQQSSYRKSDSQQDEISIVTYQKETQTKQANIFSNEPQQLSPRKNKFHQQKQAEDQTIQIQQQSQLSKKVSPPHSPKQQSVKSLTKQVQKLKENYQNVKQKLKKKQNNYKKLAKQFNTYKKTSSKIQYEEITQTFYEVEIQTDIIAVKNQKALRPILKAEEQIQIEDKIMSLTEKLITREKEIELLIEKNEQKIKEQIQKNQQIQVQNIELTKKVQIAQEQNSKLKAKVQQFKNIYEQNLQIKQKQKEALQYQLELSKAKTLEGLKNLQFQTYSESGSDLPHSDRQMIFMSQKDVKTPTAHYEREYNYYQQNIQTCQAEAQTEEFQEFQYDGSREQHRILIGSANLQQKQSLQEKQIKELGGSVDLSDLQNQSSQVKQYVIEQDNNRSQSPQQANQQNKAKNQQQLSEKNGQAFDDYEVTSPINQQQFYSIQKDQLRFEQHDQNQNQNQDVKLTDVQTIQDLNEKIQKLEQKNKQLQDELDLLKRKKEQKNRHVAFKIQNQVLNENHPQTEDKEIVQLKSEQAEQQKQKEVIQIQTSNEVTLAQKQQVIPSQAKRIGDNKQQKQVQNIIVVQTNNQEQKTGQQKSNQVRDQKYNEPINQQQQNVIPTNNDQIKDEEHVDYKQNEDKVQISNHQFYLPKQVQSQIVVQNQSKQLKVQPTQTQIQHFSQPLKQNSQTIKQQSNFRKQQIEKLKLLIQDKDKIIQKLQNQVELLQQALLTQRINYQNVINSKQQDFNQKFFVKQNRLDIDRQKLQLAVNSTDSNIIFSSKQQTKLVQIDGVSMLQSKTYQINQTKLMKMSEQSQRYLKHIHESQLISAIQANQQKQKDTSDQQKKSNFELIKQQRQSQRSDNSQMLRSEVTVTIQETELVVMTKLRQLPINQYQQTLAQIRKQSAQNKKTQEGPQPQQNKQQTVNQIQKNQNQQNIDYIKEQQKVQCSQPAEQKNADHVLIRAKSIEELIEQFEKQEQKTEKPDLISIQNNNANSEEKYDIIDSITLENLPFIFVQTWEDDNQNTNLVQKEIEESNLNVIENNNLVEQVKEQVVTNKNNVNQSQKSMKFVSKNIDLSVNLFKDNFDNDKISIQPFVIVEIPKPEQNFIDVQTKNNIQEECNLLQQVQVQVNSNDISKNQIKPNVGEIKIKKQQSQKATKENAKQKNKSSQSSIPLSSPSISQQQIINIELKTSLLYIQQPMKSQPITINPFMFITCQFESAQQKTLLKQLKQYEQIIKEKIMNQKSIHIKQALSKLMQQVKECLQTIDIYEQDEGIQVEMCNYIVEQLGYKCFESLLFKKNN